MRRVVGDVEIRIAYMWIAISFLQQFRIPNDAGSDYARTQPVVRANSNDGNRRRNSQTTIPIVRCLTVGR